MKKGLAVLLAFLLLFTPFTGRAETTSTDTDTQTTGGLQIGAPHGILMEASTGQIIYEKDADVERSPASITKIMTLILIFDAIAEGKITLQDEVVTSAHAKSMGGSQVFLEEGETQTVETLIKCIVIASGNDASAAMAEFVAGSEEEFVSRMNARAKGLGMEHTNFLDCCGLTDSTGHYSSARDVALMTRELITKYPQIHDYCTIWMEDITHVTRQGSSIFTLSNTNKLLKQYPYATGLKTGFTSIAKFCLSATAEKDNVKMIAVVLGAPDSKGRFQDAQDLLNYGYANCNLYEDKEMPELLPAKVRKGVVESVPLAYEGGFSYLSLKGEDLSQIEREVILEEELTAPVEPGQKAGVIRYSLSGKTIGEVPILTSESVRVATYTDYLKKIWNQWMF